DLPVGQAAAALVVADQGVVARHLLEPAAPHRALPVVLEVVQPVRRLEQRRPVARDRVGDAHAVGRSAEADLLAGHGREDSTRVPSESGFSRRAMQVFPDCRLRVRDSRMGRIPQGGRAMADKGAPSGVGSALVLILLLTGIAIWQWPLESLRPPASKATSVDRIAALQDTPARRWQAPFVATRSDKAPSPGPGAARRPAGVAEIVSEYLK